MKANRKFLNNDDEAVSPVIAVILMVAITVVLAATVYVWVSGFGSGGGNTPSHTMSVTSGGAIVPETATTDAYKKYTVSSADPSLSYADMTFTLAGTTLPFVALTNAQCAAAPLNTTGTATGVWGACQGGTGLAQAAAVTAAQSIYIIADDDAYLNDKQLVVLDTQANSIMVNLKVR